MSRLREGVIVRWSRRRLPVVHFICSEIASFPMPRGLGYIHAFGAILVLCFAIQIISGIALSVHYTPTSDAAFESVERIMRNVEYGWLIRDIHANGASMMFIAMYIHLFRGLYYGSYKEPQGFVWRIGVVIFLMMFASSFSGHLLAWGQTGFWGMTVLANLIGAIPFFGDTAVVWLQGGSSIGDATLGRCFVFHFLAPFAVILLVILHICALHAAKVNDPGAEEAKSSYLPFFPYYFIKDAVAAALFFALFAFFVFFMPDAFKNTVPYVKANPLVTPPHVTPEWYFLPFYAMLRSVPGKLLGMLVVFASVGILFFLPWLDTSSVRTFAFRFFFWLFVVSCLGLAFVGVGIPSGGHDLVGQCLTAYYFFYFLVILPLLGFRRKRKTPAILSTATHLSAQRKEGGSGAKG